MKNFLPKLIYIFICASLLLVGFFYGHYSTEKLYLTAIGEQALIDVSRNSEILKILGDKTPIEVRRMIDLNISRHLITVIRYERDLDAKQRMYRITVLKNLASIWQKYPPFKDSDNLAMRKIYPEIFKYQDEVVAYTFTESKLNE